MTRLAVVRQINWILDKHCTNCVTRRELIETHGSNFSRIDGHCNKQCPYGKEMQGLGKQLSSGG